MLLKLHHFLARQFILNAIDYSLKMVLLVNVIKVIGPDGEDRAQVKRA